MEINIVDTTGSQAAVALLGGLTPQPSDPAVSALTPEQQQAVTVAVQTLLTQAGIADTDPVEVHFAANPKGRWAVLRVGVVLQAS